MAACDVRGIKRIIPSEWRELELFKSIYELVIVPVVTMQLRYNGWVTALRDLEKSRFFFFLLFFSESEVLNFKHKE